MAISNDTATPTSTAGSGRILIVVCFAFFATGLSQATIGPAIPDLARHTHSGVVAVGSSLTAFYLCALGALSASSFLIDRIGRVRILFVGMVACIVGSAGLALSPTLPLLIMSAGCMGLGVGSVNLIGNVLAAEASSGAGPINLVNAMFGIGSIVSPALIGASMTYLSTGIPAIWSAPCAMIVAACLLVFWVPKRTESRRQLGHQVLPERSSPSAVFRSPLAWTIVVLTIMYSVVDAGLSGWLPTLLHRAAALPLALGAMTVSWFWFLMTASRFIAAWASRFVRPNQLLRGCVGLCIAAGVLLIACVLTKSQILGFAAATVFGLGAGPVFPTAIAMTQSLFPHHTGIATGLAQGASSIGGAFMPLALGALIVNIGALAGTGMLMVATLMMALMLMTIEFLTPKVPASEPAPVAEKR